MSARLADAWVGYRCRSGGTGEFFQMGGVLVGMSFVRVVNESRQRVLGGRIRVAHTLTARMRGFILRKPPAAGEGLFLAPCRAVHTYWMRFPLDVLLIDEAGTVIAAHADLPPGTRTPLYRRAHYALELPTGAIVGTGTLVGDRLSWKPVVLTEATVHQYG